MADRGRDGVWRRALTRAAGLAMLGLVGAPGPEATADVAEPVLKWERGGCTSWCQTGWYASPAIADIDDDGQTEVVWGSYDLVSLDGTTGGLEWRATHAHRVYPGVVIAHPGVEGYGHRIDPPGVSRGLIGHLPRVVGQMAQLVAGHALVIDRALSGPGPSDRPARSTRRSRP